MHCHIYELLKERDILKHYLPENVIKHLERINMLGIGDQWKLSEIPRKSKVIIEKFGLPIMQYNGVRV